LADWVIQRDAFMEMMLFDGGIRPHTSDSDSDSDSDYWVADNFFKKDLHTQIAEAYLALAYVPPNVPPMFPECSLNTL
jgi:hypothetical protein